MNEFQLKYGTNPNQKPARIYMADGSDLPVQILNGRPGYINFLDAFNSWQLVRDLKKALGQPAAASFKHVSPAGAAIGLPLDETLRAMYHIAPETELSPLACAYARARGADRMSSFGDWIALSDVCDLSTAKLIQHEVSDGIIAPGYDADALEVLKSKKKGGYAIVQIDADYEPKPLETRTVFGVTFEQGRQDLDISNETMLQNVVTENKVISDGAAACVILASGGYPLAYEKGKEITGLTAGQLDAADVTVYHAGTAIKDGSLVTNGGRVLGVTATANTLPEALKKAYAATESIHFDKLHKRSDIGARALAAMQ